MKVVYSGLKYTNYNSKQGFSFEHNNFYSSLSNLPETEVIYFPYERILELGRDRGGKELLDLIKKEKPDLFFAFMFTDELNPEILDEIKKYTKSVAWFSDDHWRFDNYSKYYAPHFSWVVTTYSKALEWYQKTGINNVIHCQWAANTASYRSYKENIGEKINVSFVGLWSRPRQRIISAIKKAGIDVKVYGRGWPDGNISNEKIIEIFSTSKINLALNPAPGFFNTNSLGRLFLKRSMDKIVPGFHILRNFKSWFKRGIPQIKARHFEIPACGGFLITAMADNLGDYYKIGEEIVVYKNIEDLIDKIKYYLKNEEERNKIAEAGFLRTINEHTYEKRFDEIFKIIFKANKK